MENFLDKLNDEQKRGVLHTEGPLLILSGAGSGKTLVITTKIAYLIREKGISPEEILAVTFTNKSAKEMRERVLRFLPEIRPYRLWVRTFHATCLRVLKSHAEKIGYSQNFVVLDEHDRESIIKKIIKDKKLTLPATIKPSGIIKAISDAKNILVGPKEYKENIGASRGHYAIIAIVYERYQEFIKKENAMDFDDLIFNTIELFEHHKDVLDAYRAQWRYILIDEFQDTNPSQYRLVRLLADKKSNLTIVGDDDQSIYSFRGAVVKNILDFPKDYPGCGVIRLEENYRCPKDIVAAAFAVVKNNTKRHRKDIFSNKESAHPIELIRFEADRDEASYVANEAEHLFSLGFEAHDIAVLYRTNAQSRLFEKEFLSHNIPYKVVGGLRFYERAEVKDAVAYLRLVNEERENVSFRRVCNVPPRGLGEKSLDRFEQFAEENTIPLFSVLDRLDELGVTDRGKQKLISFRDHIRITHETFDAGGAWSAVLRDLIDGLDYYSVYKDDWRNDEAKANIAQLGEAMDEFRSANPGARLTDFLEEVQLLTSADEHEGDQVTLMTVHNAKGLEFGAVFLAGLETGVFPHALSLDSNDGIEEERRLCYVGMTRAKAKLYLTHTQFRITSRGPMHMTPSPFIAEIPEELVTKKDIGSFGGAAMNIDDDAFSY